MGGKALILCLVGLLVIAGCVQTGGNGSGNDGVTQVTTTAPACSAGTTVCGGGCVNLTSDNQNCGTCGRDCGKGLYCCNGECCLLILCREHETKCGASNMSCTDLQTDTFSCGACGVKCSFEPPLETCCNGTCRNLQMDSSSCGTCGHKCSSGQVCCAGNCMDPAVNSCQCEPSCPAGQTCCNRTCVDLMTDDENCGMCGNACDNPMYAREFCRTGMCVHFTGYG